MNFNIGDKVLFKSDKQQGIIVKVNSLYKVVVETLDGFDVVSSVNELVKIEKGTDKLSSYGNVFYHKDKMEPSKIINKKEKSKLVLKIDLHIELLSKSYTYLDNFEIVQIQLDECHKKIENALNSNYQKLIIVHGVGTGVLRNEVHKLLKNYKLRYYLSKDAGATEVML